VRADAPGMRAADARQPLTRDQRRGTMR